MLLCGLVLKGTVALLAHWTMGVGVRVMEKIYREELHGVAAHGMGSSPARRLDGLCEVYSREILCKMNANQLSPKASEPC